MEALTKLTSDYKNLKNIYNKAEIALENEEKKLKIELDKEIKTIECQRRILRINSKCADIIKISESFKLKMIKLESKMIDLSRDYSEKKNINNFVEGLVEKLRKSFKKDTKSEAFSKISKKETLGNILNYRFHIKNEDKTFELNIQGYVVLLKTFDYQNPRKYVFDFKSHSIEESYNQIITKFNSII